MKTKAFAAIVLTSSLMMTLFLIPSVVSPGRPPIKIGVIGPWALEAGVSIKSGTMLASKEIRTILGHPIKLIFSDEFQGFPDGTAATGAAAMAELMVANVDFVIGGFGSESVFGAREVAMDNQIIYFITGAAIDELIDHPDVATYPDTVRGNYERYKYLFRVTPPNSTTLSMTLAGFLSYAMVTKLMPIYRGYGKPVKIAVVSENLVWADSIHAYLSNPLFWNYVMGLLPYGGVDVVFQARVDAIDPSWVPGVMAAVDASGARLIIHALSGPVGRAFVNEWATVQVKAVPVGINVVDQESIQRGRKAKELVTAENSEYETFLAASGTETPIVPGLTDVFWAEYVAKYRRWPIYTAFGAYDAVYTLAEAIETWGATYGDFGPRPIHDNPDYDKLIPMLEQTDRISTVGQFKFTGPNPLPDQTYPYSTENPTMKGTLHDVFVNEIGPTWTQGYVRPLVVQSQAGRLEVVWPMDQSYSKIWALPRWMYPYPTDVNQDGTRNAIDIQIVSFANGTSPGDPLWQFVADVDGNWLIDDDDIDSVVSDYGKPIPLPLEDP